jgi:hypothetical protein
MTSSALSNNGGGRVRPSAFAAKTRLGSTPSGSIRRSRLCPAQLLVIVFALATYSVIQRNARLSREDKAAMRTAKP